jgi:hypothetical protein
MATKEEQQKADQEAKDRAAKEQAQAAKDPQAQPATQPLEQRDTSKTLKGAELDSARRTGALTGGTTPAAQAEYERLDVNPNLDNRTGDQRPPLVDFPAKPQQVDGPEVGHFAEHDEEHGEEFAERFGPKVDRPAGMKSEGQHGLGDTDPAAAQKG